MIQRPRNRQRRNQSHQPSERGGRGGGSRGRGRGLGGGGGGGGPLPSNQQVVSGAHVSIILKVDQPSGLQSGWLNGRVGRVQRMVTEAEATAGSEGLRNLGRNGEPGGSLPAKISTRSRIQYHDIREEEEENSAPLGFSLGDFFPSDSSPEEAEANSCGQDIERSNQVVSLNSAIQTCPVYSHPSSSSPTSVPLNTIPSIDCPGPCFQTLNDVIYVESENTTIHSSTIADDGPFYRAAPSYSLLPTNQNLSGRRVSFPDTHRFLSGESQIFKDIMSLPVPPDGSAEHVDEHPVRLEGVSKDAFQQLLRVLYPPQWTLVLELADRYCMDSLRKHAIEKMQSVRDYDPVDKVVAARRSKIKQWLLPSFDETPRRPKSLNQHDVDLLGLEAVLRLASIRERIAC
ncbi:hypothetical protein BT96DRAFT_1015804 [Gymnopus androsaceus JB14]|uniref:BTB domain-containing protein n=1 Tax=Gymnopus androsaceus JB14 TaxID=1447944 RepID=A0A6A4I3P6_9AGAR|nr:hypothetical protein BT96DRAFT_1015804 [Gymnopus androsaceus JB14]